MLGLGGKANPMSHHLEGSARAMSCESAVSTAPHPPVTALRIKPGSVPARLGYLLLPSTTFYFSPGTMVPVYPITRTSSHPFICRLTHPPTHPPTHSSIYPSIQPLAHQLIYPPTYPFIHPSTHPPTHPSITHLSVYHSRSFV